MLDNDIDGADTKPIYRTITLPDAEIGQAAVAAAKKEANRFRERVTNCSSFTGRKTRWPLASSAHPWQSRAGLAARRLRTLS